MSRKFIGMKYPINCNKPLFSIPFHSKYIKGNPEIPIDL